MCAFSVVRGIDPVSKVPIEVRIEDGVVARIAKLDEGAEIAHRTTPGSASIPSPLPYLARGLIDLQVNGYRGIDYSEPGLDGAAIETLIGYLAAGGTTQHLATIVTRSGARIAENCRVIASARAQSALVAAAIPGIHLEGPFLSPEDGPRGAHDPRFLRLPDFEEFLEWQDAAEGLIKMVTLAPELEGALEFIEKLCAHGVVAAIGHTAASPERIREAIAAGCSLSTHLGNGSHAMLPRLRNYLWEQLAADELNASIIADGFHLPPSVIKTFARAKGFDRLMLVSDVAQFGGRQPGRYHWGELDVEVCADGHVQLAGTEYLAGAGQLLDWDIAHFIRATGCALGDAIKLCTENPAKLLKKAGLSLSGRIEVGAAADLVLFDTAQVEPLGVAQASHHYGSEKIDKIRILQTVVGGIIAL